MFGHARMAVAAATVALGSAALVASSWTVESVLPGVNAGIYSSLVHDNAGDPAIAYSLFGSSGNELRLARRTGATWTTELVDRGLASMMSAATDPLTGLPAIAYAADKTSGPSGTRIKLARWTGSAWSLADIDAGESINSLAYDADNRPAIVYSSAAKGGKMNLKIARETATGWATETIFTNNGISYKSLAFDPLTGSPTVVFLTLVTVNKSTRYHEIIFARRTSTTWAFETIDTQIPVVEGNFMDLAYDPFSGIPVVAYRARHKLYFAERVGGTWLKAEIDDGSSHGISLRHAPDGSPAIAYDQDNSLKIARRAGAQWSIEIIEDFVSTAFVFASRPSLRFLPDGRADVSYGAWSPQGTLLRFARGQ